MENIENAKLMLKKDIRIDDKNENKFAILLYNKLKQYDISIEVIDNKYSNVDYKLTNLITNDIMYLELKTRNNNSTNFNTFIIGLVKLQKIKENYKNTILIWSFIDKIYFANFNENMVNYEHDFIYNSYIIKVPKNECLIGLDCLIRSIKNNLNIIE